MGAVERVVTDSLDVWVSGVKEKSSAGRGARGKLDLYGVKKLRELILDLAVRGMLVPQKQDDSSSKALLEKISAEKAKLFKTKKLKIQKTLPLVDENEKTITLPKNWIWTRLENAIIQVTDGEHLSPQKTTSGVKLLTAKHVREGGVNTSDPQYVSKEDAKKFLLRCNPEIGDILVCSRGTIGRSCVNEIDETFCLMGSVILLKTSKDVLSYYLNYFIKSPIGQLFIRGVTKGMAVNALYLKDVKLCPVPLPPFEEQKRIVAKVDELMALCDALETQQENSIAAHQTLVETLLATLTNAPGANAFQQAWTRIAEHFDTLFTTEHSIDQLKQTILQLAVMGKLVPQDPSDEPASVLLGKIAAEKERLVKEKKIKRQKALPEIGGDEKPFELPEGWEFVRLGVALKKITDGTHHSPPNGDTGDHLYISAKNIKETGVQLSNATYVTRKVHEEIYSRCDPENGDILYIKDGATTGIVTINDIAEPFSMLSSVALLKCPKGVLNKYLLLSLRSPTFYKGMRADMTGVAITRVTLKKLDHALIGLPPLEEQYRIVAKLDELMSLIDKLEQKIIQQSKTAVAFAQVAVMAITGKQTKKVSTMKESPSTPSSQQKKTQARMPSSANKFVLQKFMISTGYRSLPDTSCEFHTENDLPSDSEPICLVGLNGSGKSNLIEAMADVFCYLEMINLPWKSLRSASSKYRKNDHHFELEYTIINSEGRKDVVIKKEKKIGAKFLVTDENGNELEIESAEERLKLLPRRIIGYSSGLNETVSHTFLRTRTLYSEEVREAAPRLGEDLSLSTVVFDTNTLYMDYENNAEILLCNFIFRSSDELGFINKFTRVEGVSSFELKFNRKIAGKSSDNIARITDELDSYVRKFAACADQNYEPDQHEHRFRYELTNKVKKKFRKEFETAENLFLAMYKWSLLNALVLSGEQRKVFLKEDVTTGTLERPPVVAPKDRLFDVADVKVKLSKPNKIIDYSGLSDGEHQFIQVFGTILLFNQPGTLFLLDEPESHFNPEWRTKFNLILNGIPNASTHEFVISTHSPYIVSGSKGSNVYKFTRKNADVDCQPIDFETYGASFDFLLKKLFSIDSLIDESAREEMENILKRGDLEEMEEAVGDFAESREKRRLYQALIEKQKSEV